MDLFFIRNDFEFVTARPDARPSGIQLNSHTCSCSFSYPRLSVRITLISVQSRCDMGAKPMSQRGCGVGRGVWGVGYGRLRNCAGAKSSVGYGENPEIGDGPMRIDCAWTGVHYPSCFPESSYRAKSWSFGSSWLRRGVRRWIHPLPKHLMFVP
jgi:hypothetical protein